MSRPPVKAIEQIRNYCEKTQCRKCIFGEIEILGLGDIDYVGCKLQMTNPCNWGLEEEEDDRQID